jgi:branched-chain amino acid aminotransferase
MSEKPYDRLDGVIWYDGQLIEWSEATLHVCSHGLHYASAVFEGERAYSGEIFKCTQHSERLKRSAQALDFEIPYSVARKTTKFTSPSRPGNGRAISIRCSG